MRKLIDDEKLFPLLIALLLQKNRAILTVGEYQTLR